MVRACVAAEVPVFGICRGIQEMNVALGGSLHYRLHLLEGTDDHRMPRQAVRAHWRGEATGAQPWPASNRGSNG